MWAIYYKSMISIDAFIKNAYKYMYISKHNSFQIFDLLIWSQMWFNHDTWLVDLITIVIKWYTWLNDWVKSENNSYLAKIAFDLVRIKSFRIVFQDITLEIWNDILKLIFKSWFWFLNNQFSKFNSIISC